MYQISLNFMNKNSTLIILGAGASVESGLYPIGNELSEIAKKILTKIPHKKNNNLYQTKEADKEFYTTLYTTLDSFSHYGGTIDAHISKITNEKKRHEILKSFIIAVLALCTQYSLEKKALFKTWYNNIGDLFLPNVISEENDLIRIKKIEQKIENINIITFNYDISLELYLADLVKNHFKNKHIAEQAFIKICSKIHHIYGSVDDDYNKIFNYIYENKSRSENSAINDFFDLLVTDYKNYSNKKKYITIKDVLNDYNDDNEKKYITIKDALNDYNDDNEKDDSDYAAISIPENDGFFDFCHQLILEIYSTQIVKKIKTIHEERSENKLKNISKKCDFLYILGYGFDKENNKRIGFVDFGKNKIKYKEAYITNFGGNIEIQKLINKFSKRCFLRKKPVIVDEIISKALVNAFNFKQ